MIDVVTHVQSTVDRVARRLSGSHRNTPAVETDTFPSLSAPLVTLYVTPELRGESREAFALLAESRTGFRVERATDSKVAAEFGGQSMVGLDEIRRLRDGLLQFQQDFLHSNPSLTAMIDPLRDPEVQQRSEKELAEQIEQARAQLEHALK